MRKQNSYLGSRSSRCLDEATLAKAAEATGKAAEEPFSFPEVGGGGGPPAFRADARSELRTASPDRVVSAENRSAMLRTSWRNRFCCGNKEGKKQSDFFFRSRHKMGFIDGFNQ